MIDTDAITIQHCSFNEATQKEIAVDTLRLDKVHTDISGNKWFKLRYYIEDAIRSGKKNLVTRGGAWSNHIIATAAAAKLSGLNSVGLIRGEEPPGGSITLDKARSFGMELIFQSRLEYRDENIPDQLNNPDYYYIPEGGYGSLGMAGAATISDYFERKAYTHICCAVGTGTMIAGLAKVATPGQSIIGIPVLKHKELDKEIRTLLGNEEYSFQLLHDYHFGGYAKKTSELIRFMNELYESNQIPTDFVYTGKLFYAVMDLTKRDFFPPGSKILVIHSGGLQGNLSLEKRTLIF